MAATRGPARLLPWYSQLFSFHCSARRQKEQQRKARARRWMIVWGGVSWRGQAYKFEPITGVGIPRRGARDEHHMVRGQIVIDQPAGGVFAPVRQLLAE